jgi:hypothetical protein
MCPYKNNCKYKSQTLKDVTHHLVDYHKIQSLYGKTTKVCIDEFNSIKPQVCGLLWKYENRIFFIRFKIRHYVVRYSICILSISLRKESCPFIISLKFGNITVNLQANLYNGTSMLPDSDPISIGSVPLLIRLKLRCHVINIPESVMEEETLTIGTNTFSPEKRRKSVSWSDDTVASLFCLHKSISVEPKNIHS